MSNRLVSTCSDTIFFGIILYHVIKLKIQGGSEFPPYKMLKFCKKLHLIEIRGVAFVALYIERVYIFFFFTDDFYISSERNQRIRYSW